MSAAARDRKSCDAGDGAACSNAGVAYEHGIGVCRDAAKATAFYRKACQAGDRPACPRAR